MEWFIALITSAEFLKYILTFLFGGGLFTGLKVWSDHKEVKQNAKIANMKTPVEIDAIQVTGLETLAKNLQADNQVLRDDRDYWKDEYEKMKTEVERLSDELERQEKRNRVLRQHIEELQKQMDNAEQRSPAHVAGRDDLTEQTVLDN